MKDPIFGSFIVICYICESILETKDQRILQHRNKGFINFQQYVDPIARGKNLGNKILKLADQDAKKYGANTIFLNVLKDSWMHNWYERHGFSDYCDNGVDKRYVRMVKHVDESTEY